MKEVAESTSRTGGGQRRSRPHFGSVFELVFTPTLLLLALSGLLVYLQSQQLDDIERREISRQEILHRLFEHLQLVAASSALVIALAVPLGVLLTRPRLRHAATVVLPLANLGQAVPSIGVLALLAIWVGFGFQMAVVALVLISFLSVLRNTMVGLTAVDPALIEAARGMGLSKRVVLLRVELPLAVPVILAGIRVALILNVGSAALATYTNAGGLGNLIETGIALNRMPILLTGAVLTATLALAVDWLAGLAERLLRPRGL
jgi:osmoprotectant transport system permease protein